MLELSKTQTKLLSDFFNDVAKGLFLGVAVNQAVPTGTLTAKLLVSVVGIIVTLSCLYAALYISKLGEKIW